MRSHELSGVTPSNRGAIALRDFIAYAERGCELPQTPSVPTQDETNDFEDAVATALRDRGLTVDQQVGASVFRIDIAIRDRRMASRYILGVECDGATYHSTRTARDRDILRQRVLESMGWRIHRIWSTEWFRNPARAIEGILNALSLAEGQPIADSVQGTPRENEPTIARSHKEKARVPKGEVFSATPSRRHEPGIPYRRFNGSANRDFLIERRYSDELAALIVRIVNTEGPIHVDCLYERLKDICGVDRIGSNVDSNIGEAIHIAVRRKEIERRRQRNFLWMKDVPLARFRLPTNSYRRPVDWIHRDEIAAATLYLIEDQFGVLRAELGRAVPRLFGLERVSSETIDFILDIADELVERGLLRMDFDQFTLPS
jgi:very-short-patch-repair endonuclease